MFKRASLHLLQHPCKIPIGLQMLMIMMMLAMLMAEIMLMADIKQGSFLQKSLGGPNIENGWENCHKRVLIS